MNSEVKGWLMIPGTNINMPVNYSNKDNNYYLYRDWKGNNYPNITWRNWYNYPDNTTYVDYRHRWGDSWQTSSKNVVLYGHNWSNLRAPFDIGSNQANDRTHRMFGQLPSYTSIEFAKWQPHIYFSTADYEGIWRVFAVGYCEISPNFFYNNPNPTKEQRQELISEWRKRSHFNFDVDVNADDVLLTLTTCTRQHGSTENQRFVVVARLLVPVKVKRIRSTSPTTPTSSILTLPSRLIWRSFKPNRLPLKLKAALPPKLRLPTTLMQTTCWTPAPIPKAIPSGFAEIRKNKGEMQACISLLCHKTGVCKQRCLKIYEVRLCLFLPQQPYNSHHTN